MSSSDPADRIFTPANVVTLVRICLVPVFVIAVIGPWPAWFPEWQDAEAWKPWVATVLFVALAATDSVDGYLARSRNEVTNFGKFIDPLADKILVAAALLVLIELGVLPSWTALIILSREFIVSGIRMVAAAQGVVIAASWFGKAKTVTQIIAIALFLIKDTIVPEAASDIDNPLYLVAWAMMIVALALTIVSMVDYFAKARVLLGFGANPHDASSTQTEGDERQANATDARGETAEDDSRTSAMAERVLDAARSRSLTVATAESLTGGLIAGALTAVPGSSDVVAGGIVSYQSREKTRLLGVGEQNILAHGVVSESVARQMAEGARRALGVDIAVSVTGIAGPGGEEEGKPVGTVWMAVASQEGVSTYRFAFRGDREAIRRQTVIAALDALARAIEAA